MRDVATVGAATGAGLLGSKRGREGGVSWYTSGEGAGKVCGCDQVEVRRSWFKRGCKSFRCWLWVVSVNILLGRPKVSSTIDFIMVILSI